MKISLPSCSGHDDIWQIASVDVLWHTRCAKRRYINVATIQYIKYVILSLLFLEIEIDLEIDKEIVKIYWFYVMVVS
mgnify:CR=1 FL=1